MTRYNKTTPVDYIEFPLSLFDELITGWPECNCDFNDIEHRFGDRLNYSLHACWRFVDGLFKDIQNEHQIEAIKNCYKANRLKTNDLLRNLILLACHHPRIAGVTEPVTREELECLCCNEYGAGDEIECQIVEARPLDLCDKNIRICLIQISGCFERSREAVKSLGQKGFFGISHANTIELDELDAPLGECGNRMFSSRDTQLMEYIEKK